MMLSLNFLKRHMNVFQAPKKKLFLVFIAQVLFIVVFVNQTSEPRIGLKLGSAHERRVALFVQAPDMFVDGNIHSQVLQCIESVSEAKRQAHDFIQYPWEGVQEPVLFDFDVFIAYSSNDGFLKSERVKVQKRLEELGAGMIYETMIKLSNMMFHEQFLRQLLLAEENRDLAHYDFFLTINSSPSKDVRDHSLQSLCGSPAQVTSILRSLNNNSTGIVVPQGLVRRPNSTRDDLLREIREKYKIQPKLSARSHEITEQIFKSITGQQLILMTDREDYIWNTDGMFWSRYSEFRSSDWARVLPSLLRQWHSNSKFYKAIELSVGILFLTIPHLDGVVISEMKPAIKPIAIYFPQYHSVPENDAIHGEGFTEWTLLKPAIDPLLAKPLSVEEGGLGYYDLTDRDVRRKQSEMARAAGIHGFMYYHYWFSGQGRYNYSNPVMGKIPELMVQDGYPDLPFFFSWANEPWTETWSGQNDGETILPQLYGDEKEWEKHFNYLLPFFKNPKYMRIDDKPIFVIYRIGHMKKVLEPMLKLWRNLAESHNLPGLYIIFTINNFIHSDQVLKKKSHQYCDAAFQFYPTIAASYPVENSSSMYNVDIESDMRQYWGSYNSFINVVRRSENPTIRVVTPETFREDLKQSFQNMITDPNFTANEVNGPNLFFITAWNEWNEQAMLEPSDMHGFAYLSALKENLESQPMTRIT